jgi:hypothetical protein
MPPSEGDKATSSNNIITDEKDRQPLNMAELLMIHHQYAGLTQINQEDPSDG